MLNHPRTVAAKKIKQKSARFPSPSSNEFVIKFEWRISKGILREDKTSLG
jgi:hypothetical protein